MNKHLRIEINGTEWVNGDFSEISFTDGPGGVRVEAKPVRAAQPSPNGGGFLEMLTGASRSRTNDMVARKRASLDPAPEAEGAVEVVEADTVNQD